MLPNTRWFFVSLLFVVFAEFGVTAEPLLEKIDLFESGKDDYALYRIPGIVVTKRGTVLAYCEARRTGKSDWDTIDLMLRRSTDDGKTWAPRVKIADVPGPKTKNPVALAQKLANTDDVTYNNPVAFANRDGSVQMLFCLEYCRCFSIRSDDDGVTWTKPVEITATFDKFRPEYDWKVLATGPGHGIQLTSGRLVVPVWLSLGTGGHAHRPSVTTTIFSDDNGKTWQRGDIAVPNTDEWINPNETVVVQLADGRVMLNVRSESKSHRRLVTISPDGATGWSPPRFDDALIEPICMGSIIRLSEKPASDKNRIVFANPHNLGRADGKIEAGKSRDRKYVTIKLSEDDGQTWRFGRLLEEGFSAYSDLAVLPDGTMLCFYERGRSNKDDKKPTSYSYLTLARFNLEWLTDKTVATPEANDDPLAAWRQGVKVRPVVAEAKGHTIHSYFNTCPESPDGRWVLFFGSATADAHLGEVRIRDRISGEEKVLARNVSAEDAHRVACQQWVSKGRRVVFHGERGGEWFVAAVDVDSANERVLAKGRLTGWGQPNTDVVPLYGPHWNPGTHRDLELLNVETGEIRTVVTNDAVKAKYPDWIAKSYGDKPTSIFFPVLSPDLSRVFFKMASPSGGDARSTSASQRQGLVCFDLANDKFLFLRERWGHPAWHPDQKTIVEMAYTLIDSDTGKERRIAGLPAVRGDHPSASPDGKLIVTDTTMDKFGGDAKEWGIVVANANGTDHVLIHRFDNSRGAVSWRRSHPHPVFSPDGRRIYFNVSSSQWTQLFVAEQSSDVASRK